MTSPVLILVLLSIQQPPAAPDPEKAISVLRNSSWYDADKQSWRPPQDLDDPDVAIRSSNWLYVPDPAKTPTPSKPAANNTGQGWFGNGFSLFDSQWLNYLVIVLLGCALSIGAILLYRRSLDAWMPDRYKRSNKVKSIAVDLTRVADLPFEVKSLQRDPLAEAELLMNQGRYGEAIVFLFGYLLLALDQSRHIRLQRGKTNRMYLRELQDAEVLRAILYQAMLAFEEVFFGRYALSRERYMEIWNQLQTFHQTMDPEPLPTKSWKPASTLKTT